MCLCRFVFTEEQDDLKGTDRLLHASLIQSQPPILVLSRFSATDRVSEGIIGWNVICMG